MYLLSVCIWRIKYYYYYYYYYTTTTHGVGFSGYCVFADIEQKKTQLFHYA